MGILLAFVVLMVPGGTARVAVSRSREVPVVGHATLLLLVVATGVAVEDVGAVDDPSAVRWLGVTVAGLGVYAAILALPVLTFRILTRKAGPTGRRGSVRSALS